MVGLDQLGCKCKDCYAFEKDKVYCIKVNFDTFVPADVRREWCEGLKNKFKENNINIIVIPLTDKGPIDVEFFKINENEKDGDK